ncbi:GNAT family N-acetyltransferase [Vaginella massiliensis]|uniref:acetyltransferase n=1 Tax=Vaginella massiliensis TaxID=1816680 RepID=UPI0008398E16|nr:acetyltransferase [Vaginella massiliensis]
MLVRVANKDDVKYADELVLWYEESARQRKTGIAKRNPVYLQRKMVNGNSIIAFDDEGKLAGFSYIETYDEEKFVVNSGLIVREDLRSSGIGKEIKHAIFALSRTKFPRSKVFSITTSLAVMRMNTQLGYKPVTFSELTQSDEFWNGCKGCKNYHILMDNDRERCICTGLVYDNLDDDFAKANKKESNGNNGVDE